MNFYVHLLVFPVILIIMSLRLIFQIWDFKELFLSKCVMYIFLLSIKLIYFREIGFLPYLKRLDLSNNQLIGFLPSDLRFAPLSFLDVSGNFLKGLVPPMLCRKPGINGNGDGGDSNCAHIACPTGTYSSTGRNNDDFNECLPCLDPQTFLASNVCNSSPQTYAVTRKHFFFQFCFLATIFLLFYCFIKSIKLKNTTNHTTNKLAFVINDSNRYENISITNDSSDNNSINSNSSPINSTPCEKIPRPKFKKKHSARNSIELSLKILEKMKRNPQENRLV